MSKKDFSVAYKTFEEADKEYHIYVDQFFNRMWEGEIIKKATKIQNKQEIEKIKKMRQKVEELRENYQRILREI